MSTAIQAAPGALRYALQATQDARCGNGEKQVKRPTSVPEARGGKRTSETGAVPASKSLELFQETHRVHHLVSSDRIEQVEHPVKQLAARQLSGDNQAIVRPIRVSICSIFRGFTCCGRSPDRATTGTVGDRPELPPDY